MPFSPPSSKRSRAATRSSCAASAASVSASATAAPAATRRRVPAWWCRPRRSLTSSPGKSSGSSSTVLEGRGPNMAASALYLKDPATTRFLSGGRAEAESLLGAPLPPLPDADYLAGRAVFSVKFHPELRKLLVRYLQAVLREIGADMGPGTAQSKDSGKEQSEYEAALERML